jgi:two-component system, response regulator YesN
MRFKSDVDKLRANLFTERLLKKGMNTEDLTLKVINENYHFSFKSGIFQVCAVKIDCGFKEQYNNAIKVLEQKIVQILDNLLKEHCFDMGIYSDDSVTYCILNYEVDLKKTIRKQMKAVLDELLLQKVAFEEFEFSMGVGSVVEEIRHLKDTFRAARYSIGQRILLGTGKFIEETPIQVESQIQSTLLAEINKRMGAAIEVLDKSFVLNSIDSLKKQIETEKYFSGQEIFSLIKHICEMYLILLRNNQIQIQNGEEFYDKFCIHANRCSSIQQLFQYLSVMIGESLDVIIEDKKQVDTKPIRLAKQYIQQNYMKNISLAEVSSFVGFNSTYLSTLFKKNGNNFVDYISEVRMNKAKELLRETNLNIAVICEQVGYNDLKHFTNSFKKNTGIKPNEYRKLYS